MKKNRGSRVVAIQVCRSKLYVAVCHREGDGPLAIRTHQVTWRRDSPSFHTDAGRTELTEALKTIVDVERLQGESVFVSLDGDFCVTRTVTGDETHVNRELEQLAQRSPRYLSLGHGQKVSASSVRNLDARNRHGLLTVVNYKTLDALDDIAMRAGIELKYIEPSLLSLSRLMGKTNVDRDNPALIVNISEQGIELGISNGGHPFLDYRPAGKVNHEQVGTIVVDQLSRLQRYCDRYIRFTDAKLTQAFFFGSPADVTYATSEFPNDLPVSANITDLAHVDDEWEFDGAAPSVDFCAVLGVALLGIENTSESGGPNLIEQLQARQTDSLLRLACKTLWPIVVAATVLITINCGLAYERYCVSVIERQAAPAQMEMGELVELANEIDGRRNYLDQLTHLRARLDNPPWSALTDQVGQCLPGDAWLETLSLQSGGELSLRGSAKSEESAYTYVKMLGRVPLLAKVALAGTQPAGTVSQPQTEFEIHGTVKQSNDRNESHDDNH